MEKVTHDPRGADTSNPAYRHGHSGGGRFSPEYQSWATMIVRCTNPNRTTWKHYGGRGIKVCSRWRLFENFLADMGRRPDGMTLDHRDNDKNYCRSNCRWADLSTQNRNSSQVIWVELRGARKRLVEWCETIPISINTVRARVKFQGMTYEQALTKSTVKNCEHWGPKRF